MVGVWVTCSIVVDGFCWFRVLPCWFWCFILGVVILVLNLNAFIL